MKMLQTLITQNCKSCINQLYFRNEDVANFNYSKLQELHQPIAKIIARHSSTYAAKFDSDEMSGLEPCIFVAKEAKVMLIMKLWTDVGLCNGSTGQVVDIIMTATIILLISLLQS